MKQTLNDMAPELLAALREWLICPPTHEGECVYDVENIDDKHGYRFLSCARCDESFGARRKRTVALVFKALEVTA